MREELLIEAAEEALKNGPHRFIRPDDKVFYVDGFKDGYKLGLDAKINKTTISDAPALPETECNECGKLCTPSEMTDDRRMCKDCYIKWLEGQRAELKETNEGYCRSRDRLISIGFPNFKDCKEYADQLTKAKDIISKLANLDGAINIPMDKVISLRVKAEEFLKEHSNDR